MTKRTVEATLPDGTVVTRTSEQRIYTHVAIAWDQEQNGENGWHRDAGWVVLGFAGSEALAQKTAAKYPNNGWTQRQVIECHEVEKRTKGSKSMQTDIRESWKEIDRLRSEAQETEPTAEDFGAEFEAAGHLAEAVQASGEHMIAAIDQVDSESLAAAIAANTPQEPTPASAPSTAKGATRMAITDRTLEPGTKLVARYKGEDYRAEVVKVDQNGNEATRYRMTLKGETKDYKSPSAMGSAIMGVDKDGKPRTCNGWSFWSIDAGEAATEAPDLEAAVA